MFPWCVCLGVNTSILPFSSAALTHPEDSVSLLHPIRTQVVLFFLTPLTLCWTQTWAGVSGARAVHQCRLAAVTIMHDMQAYTIRVIHLPGIKSVKMENTGLHIHRLYNLYTSLSLTGSGFVVTSAKEAVFVIRAVLAVCRR